MRTHQHHQSSTMAETDSPELTKTHPAKDDTSIAAAAQNQNPINRAVAELARAYMNMNAEEMRDDVPETTRSLADNDEEPSPIIADLNIQEIISDIAKSHSLSTASYSTPLQSKSSRDSSRDAASKSSFPSAAVSNNDEIISRFGSIIVTETNDTESISELGTMIEARGVMFSLKTELMSWTETGCCMSPHSMRAVRTSRFEETEESFDEEEEEVVLVEESAVENQSAGASEGSDVEDGDVQYVAVEEEASVEMEEEFPEVRQDEGTMSAESRSDSVEASISVETDQTEPTKNSERSDEETRAAQKMDESACDEATAADEADDSVALQDTEDVDRKDSNDVHLAPERQASAASAPSEETNQEVARCSSPSVDGSVDSEGSISSAEVTALIASIKRCSSPSIDTEGSVTSADVGAILAAVKNESPLASREEDNTVSRESNDGAKSEPAAAESYTVEEREEAMDKQDNFVESVNKVEAGVKTEQTLVKPIAVKAAPRTPSPFTSILKLTTDVPPSESLLSPHSVASCVTDITSNQTSTPLPPNKTVRWSMSLDALSSEGDFVRCRASKSESPVSSPDVTRESNDSPSSVPTPSRATGVIESLNLANESCSSPLHELTASWVAKLKKDYSILKDDIVSWTEFGACSRDTTCPSPVPLPQEEAREVDGTVQCGGEAAPDKIKRESLVTTKVTETSIAEDSVKESVVPSDAARSTEAACDISCPEVRNSVKEMRRTECLHEDVYKERDYLREWKLDAEETMKCQDAVTGVLREQKSTLIKQCNELERAIKDLKAWKFDAGDEMKSQSARLEDLMSEKSDIMKKCEEYQETIQELTNWKFAAEDALAIREAELKQMRLENSTLTEECREQRDAIKDLAEWRIESMEMMKNQLAELESTRSENLALTTQCKTYETSIQQLTKWKSDAEPVLESNVAELKELKRDKYALTARCDDQQIALDKLNRWKMNAEEEMMQNLSKLKMFEKKNSDLITRCAQYKESCEQLAKWKSDAEDTIKNQINTIEELTQWKINATVQTKEQSGMLESLQQQNADLNQQCNEYKTSVEELTTWKVNAEKAQTDQLAEIDHLKAELEAGLNDEERKVIEELTKWKADAEESMKNKETELNELQSHYLSFGKQCNEQKELIQQKDAEIKRLAQDMKEASKKVARLEKDTSKQANKIKSYEDTIRSTGDELAAAKAEIAQLKDKLENEGQPYREEVAAMKIAHHKELMVLKTERHMLASKIEKLTSKSQEIGSRVTNLNVEMEELENKYQQEKEEHQQSKAAMKKLEKALKSSEKKRKQIEKKLASDADFCIE